MESRMSNPEAISIIIPWSNRPELELMLARNRAEFKTVDAEVVIVNCAGNGAMLDGAINRSRCDGVRRIDTPAASFNKCLALNLGAHFSRGSVLFMLDADILLESGFLRKALSEVSSGSYVSLDRVVETEPAARTDSYLTRMVQNTEFVCRDGKVIRFEHERVYFEDSSRGGPGMVMLRKEDFRAVGGMNSQLPGWGYEDLDLHLRLNAVRGLPHARFGQAAHISHGDDKRNLAGTTKVASQQLNIAICYGNYARGNFLGTLEADIARWSERIIERSAPVAGGALAF